MLVALAVPAPAFAGTKVSAFFYPWYATVARDGAFVHWSQAGHAPPDDIASSYFPARGLYSSTDLLVLGRQLEEIRGAGIDEIAVSWWGRGSFEDMRLPAVAAAARAAVRRARRGEGPSLIECKTYRIRGHSRSDRNLYRTKEEIEDWRINDPILRLEREALAHDRIDAAALRAIEADVEAEIETAIAFARASPDPDPSDLTRDVYA